MHAAVHQDFKAYVVEEHSQADFDAILEDADFIADYFDSAEYFQDTDLEALLLSGKKVLSMSRDDILQAMGEKATPGLLENFKTFLEDDWDTLDFLEAVEPRMHAYSRKELAAFPPVLKTKRISPKELVINVRSHRKLWGLAKGFIAGFSKHYGDTLEVKSEITGNNCRFDIKVIS